MIERVIVLPLKDNAGLSLARVVSAIRRELLDIAGGFSEVKQSGRWRDGSKVYRDTSVKVSTTVDHEQDAAIVARLPEWCERLKQVCLYTHAIEVQADFVYPVSQDMATVA